MPLTVQQPFGRDVTKKNPIGVVFLLTPDGPVVIPDNVEAPDGSMRIIPDTTTGVNFEFQLKASGVWNDTGIQIATASIHIGNDLILSTAGEWLQTFGINADQQSLIPHVNYDDEGTDLPHSPVLSRKQIRTIVQPDDSSEITGTSLETTINAPTDLLASKIYLKTGSIGATESIQVTFRRNNSSGPIFWERSYPASLMATPNTEFEIDLLGLLGAFNGEPISHEFISSAPLSLKTNAAQTQFFLASDFFIESNEDILSDNMVLSNDLDLIFQEDGGFVVNDIFEGGGIG